MVLSFDGRGGLSREGSGWCQWGEFIHEGARMGMSFDKLRTNGGKLFTKGDAFWRTRLVEWTAARADTQVCPGYRGLCCIRQARYRGCYRRVGWGLKALRMGSGWHGGAEGGMTNGLRDVGLLWFEFRTRLSRGSGLSFASVGTEAGGVGLWLNRRSGGRWASACPRLSFYG